MSTVSGYIEKIIYRNETNGYTVLSVEADDDDYVLVGTFNYIAEGEFIKAKVRSNNKITRQAIADSAGVSVKTIQRTIKEIENLRYIGTGNNGHWELNEKRKKFEQE